MKLSDFKGYNVNRNEDAKIPASHTTKTWETRHYSRAIGGEIGEVLDAIKKLDRHSEIGTTAYLQSIEELGYELADVICYLCLFAEHLDLSIMSVFGSDWVNIAPNDKKKPDTQAEINQHVAYMKNDPKQFDGTDLANTLYLIGYNIVAFGINSKMKVHIPPKNYEISEKSAIKAIAEAIIHIYTIANYYEIDLEKACANKFNLVSQKLGVNDHIITL